MLYMFFNATSFDQDLCWDLTNVVTTAMLEKSKGRIEFYPSCSLKNMNIPLSLTPSLTAVDKHRNRQNIITKNYYKRYPVYPTYCSIPEDMWKRSIPPINHGIYSNSTLLHVTAVIRHGARTPWAAHTCWSDYWNSSMDTSIWDCELTTMTGVSFPGMEEHIKETSMFLFEKRYDALQKTPQITNVFNGTCQVGQLLLQGFDQELRNGKQLRDTYIRRESTRSGEQTLINDSMVLFDLTKGLFSNKNTAMNIMTEQPYQHPYFYYRADDDQRTVISGQVLIKGLFGDLLHQHSFELERDINMTTTNSNIEGRINPIIVVHTADRPRDILAPNNAVCPKLDDLERLALESEQYIKKFETSEEAQKMNKLMEVNLTNGVNFRAEALDCLMTSICSDKDLPTILRDYGSSLDPSFSNTENNFERLMNYSIQAYSYKLLYNNSIYSRMAMGPLWNSILENINHFLVPRKYFNDKENQYETPKLALFSGHDTTIMSLLASLGEQLWDGSTWTPYASMFIIELHQLHGKEVNLVSFERNNLYPSEKAFRIVYNGIVLTPRIKGCPKFEDLCDITILIDLVTPFTELTQECSQTQNEEKREEKYLNRIGISSLFLTIVISIVSGCCCTLLLIHNEYGLINTCSEDTDVEDSQLITLDIKEKAINIENMPVYVISKNSLSSNTLSAGFTELC